MRKSVFITFSAVFLFAICFAVAEASENIRLFVNGKEIYSDVPPQIINGRTMVPIRVIAENLGANVDWNDATGAVDIKWNKKEGLINAITEMLKNDPDFINALQAIIENYKSSQQAKPQATQQSVTNPQLEQQPQSVSTPQQLQQLQQFIQEQQQKAQQQAQQILQQYIQQQVQQVQQPAQPVQPIQNQQPQQPQINIESQIDLIKRQAQSKRDYIINLYNIEKSQLDRQKEDALRAAVEDAISRGGGQSGLIDYNKNKVEQQFAPLYQKLEADKDYNLSQVDNWENMMIQQLQR